MSRAPCPRLRGHVSWTFPLGVMLTVARRFLLTRTAWPRKRGHGSTSVSVFCQKGGSPFQVDALRLVAERNCVVARRTWGVPGGERPVRNESELDSAGCLGEPAAKWRSPDRRRKPVTLRGSVLKRWRGAPGGWRRNGGKAEHMTQRDLSGVRPCRAGVRGAIVARKPGNAGRAKGSRKMDVE